MKKMFAVAEIKSEENDDGSTRWYVSDVTYGYDNTSRDEAVAAARKKATKYVGDTYGIFELTGTVIHPVPELDITPVA